MDQLLHRIRDGLSRGAYPNERAVSTSIIVPILRALGWDDSDPDQVLPEHATGRGRVDYALRCPPHAPAAFIEVKGVGRSSDADRQLFEYAFHEGVQLAVLTDGREWNFYVPAQQGSYSERRAYQLVLDERDVAESRERLHRYLERDRLASGAALEAATLDYLDARSRREAMGTLPKAWAELVDEPDPLLVEALLERTEALCGFRPGDEQAIAFLREQAPAGATATPRRERPPSVRASTSTARPARDAVDDSPARLADAGGEGGPRRWIVGERKGSARTAIDAFVGYIDALLAAFPDRRQQIIAAARTRSRNNIAVELADVYPRQPEIAVRSNRRLAAGLFLGTNLSNASKRLLARQMARAAGLSFGDTAALELTE